MWERRSEPRGELRVTLISLFVAGTIGVHPPPPQHLPPLPLLRHDLPGILSGTFLPVESRATYRGFRNLLREYADFDIPYRITLVSRTK